MPATIETPAGGGTTALDNEVLHALSGIIVGDPGFTYDPVTNRVTVVGSEVVTSDGAITVPLTVKGHASQGTALQVWAENDGTQFLNVANESPATNYTAALNFVWNAQVQGWLGRGSALDSLALEAYALLNLRVNGSTKAQLDGDGIGFLGVGRYGNIAPDTAAQLAVENGDAARIGLRVKGAAAQTANVLEVVDSSDAALAVLDPTGLLALGHGTPTFSAHIQRTGGNLLMLERTSGQTASYLFQVTGGHGSGANGSLVIGQDAGEGSYPANGANIAFKPDAAQNVAVQVVGATSSLVVPGNGSGDAQGLAVGVAAPTDARVQLLGFNAALPTLVVDGAPSVTANILEVRTSAGADLVTVGPDGDLTFEAAGAGLLFGEISAHDNTTTTVLAAQDTFYQVTIFGTNGEANGTTPDHTNDHVTVPTAGKYLVTMSASIKSSQATLYDMHVKANNGAKDFGNLTVHRDTTTADRHGAVAISGIADLAANDTLELWVQRADGGAASKSLTFVSVTLSLVQVGG